MSTTRSLTTGRLPPGSTTISSPLRGAVDAHCAGAADRTAAGTAHAERAVDLVADDEQRIEDAAVIGDLDRVALIPGFAAILFGVEAADFEVSLHGTFSLKCQANISLTDSFQPGAAGSASAWKLSVN